MPESWYGLVSGDEDLMQGDFIYECPIVVPAVSKLGEGMTIEATVRNYNVVILSQSCDMKYKKIKLVLEEYAKKYTHLKSDNSKEALRRGYNPGHHLLAKCELDGFGKDAYLVVEFKSVFSVPLDYISEKEKHRISDCD